MSWPLDTNRVLEFDGYVEFKDFEFSTYKGVGTLEWKHTDPEPTEQSVAARRNSQEYADHIDPAKRRRKALAAYMDTLEGRVLALTVRVMIEDKPGSFKQFRTKFLERINAGEGDE